MSSDGRITASRNYYTDGVTLIYGVRASKGTIITSSGTNWFRH